MQQRVFRGVRTTPFVANAIAARYKDLLPAIQCGAIPPGASPGGAIHTIMEEFQCSAGTAYKYTTSIREWEGDTYGK